MEKLGKLVVCMMCLTVFTLVGSTTSTANVLVNPGFEADAGFGNAPTAATTGWTQGAPFDFTTSAPGDPVRTGVGSLKLAGPGGFAVPVAFQTFAASPGQVWDLQGYMLSQTCPQMPHSGC